MWPQARRPLSRIFFGAARQSPRTCCGSGAKDNQLGLSEALANAREGDPLVVGKLDRPGRSLKHLVETVAGLHTRSIGSQGPQEQIDATASGGKRPAVISVS